MELLDSIRRNAIGLALFAMVTAGAIAVTQVGTKQRIERNIQQASVKALNDIVPDSQYDNDLLADTLPASQFDTELLGPLPDDAVIYLARRTGKVHSVIIPAIAPDGYTTHIRMIIGIRGNGSLAGVRVLKHKETPGLGDKIDVNKSDWIHSFDNKSLSNPNKEGWQVKKDGGQFDQFTGATITPRAVIRAVKKALIFFENNKSHLINQRLVEPEKLTESEKKTPHTSSTEEAH